MNLRTPHSYRWRKRPLRQIGIASDRNPHLNVTDERKKTLAFAEVFFLSSGVASRSPHRIIEPHPLSQQLRADRNKRMPKLNAQRLGIQRVIIVGCNLTSSFFDEKRQGKIGHGDASQHQNECRQNGGKTKAPPRLRRRLRIRSKKRSDACNAPQKKNPRTKNSQTCSHVAYSFRRRVRK